MLACCAAVTAQELGYWRAAGSSAQTVTGDVGFSDAKIAINFYTFPIVRARDLEPGEVSSVFDADSNSGHKGHLYKLNIPATRKFMHKNTLCGAEDTQWLATYVEGNSLNLAFFSGEKAPVFTLDAISNSSHLCGTYTYAR
ncbi:hypothetical protein H7849_18090 [Alloacidobacterium dinghuense]|uniref:Uncharacterized protein n=2 Tax=Alloacidobacterium dinghuense TaxID=2763107 RepID=A0A7G8BR86_9BACT|nr:hypothetical protein H7849_18090 [Alloacidobacterium dinghuense]